MKNTARTVFFVRSNAFEKGIFCVSIVTAPVALVLRDWKSANSPGDTCEKYGEYGRIGRAANGDSVAVAARCSQKQFQYSQHPAGGVRGNAGTDRQAIRVSGDQPRRR